ncbi:hypothetical protein EBM89_05850 [Cellulomonas triticagri]|uniref:Uncharacterized protein n=1 Tax=Cellulomonas triticagri TaxID=2483352 RepID=A0A3M2JH26_9CELL|nr:hypothetical protein EBM89_05850 [Cellulomonas triticagri]
MWTTVVVVAALAVSAGLGWVAAAGVLRLADRTPPADPAAVPEPEPVEVDPGTRRGRRRRAGDGPDGDRARARLRGGTWIGVLERLAVTGTLLAGEPGGVAVVVAIKGLGRYPELRGGDDPGVSERFVIGTLASLVWAGAAGVLGRWLLTR